jgi:hypothetical protein
MSASAQKPLRDSKEQSVREKLGSAADTIPKQSVPILNSQVYWQGRISEEMQYLFGTEEGAIGAIRFISEPNEGGWTHRLSDYVWLWICFALLIPIGVLLSVRWVHLMELWLQFPHFWGMTIGVLLWTFLPESLIGPIIIGLTIVSLFRPSWARHRPGTKPF